MRHLKAGRKLNRTSSHRKALFRNLAAALFHHESIKTTNPKALELRRVADRLISLAKTNSAHAVRLAFAYLAGQGSGEEALFRHRREIHRDQRRLHEGPQARAQKGRCGAHGAYRADPEEGPAGAGERAKQRKKAKEPRQPRKRRRNGPTGKSRRRAISRHKIVRTNGGSSNGRTQDSGSCYLGSNPSPPVLR